MGDPGNRNQIKRKNLAKNFFITAGKPCQARIISRTVFFLQIVSVKNTDLTAFCSDQSLSINPESLL
jgi:hypothetical protein